jgi:hypothetical protein
MDKWRSQEGTPTRKSNFLNQMASNINRLLKTFASDFLQAKEKKMPRKRGITY